MLPCGIDLERFKPHMERMLAASRAETLSGPALAAFVEGFHGVLDLPRQTRLNGFEERLDRSHSLLPRADRVRREQVGRGRDHFGFSS